MNKYESVIILSANAPEEATVAYYILFTFDAKPEFIAEFERILRLDEIVLKHMVIRKDK